MKQVKEEWVVGLDEDHFNCDDTYPSKEEAIKAGREELMNAEPYNEELMNAEPYNIESYTSYSEVFHDDIDDDIMCFYIGRITSPCPKVYADDVIQDLTDRAYAIYGEYAESFLEDVNSKQKEELERAINKVIQRWIDKHGLNINAFLVENVEQVKV